MKSLYVMLTMCLIFFSGSFGWVQSAMGDITPMTIKLSSAKPATDARGMAGRKFKELIEKKTGGKVKVNLYLAASLYGTKAEAEALSSGAIDMVSTSPYTLRRFDYVFSVGGVPNLFPGFEKSWPKFWDDPAGGGAIQKAAEKIGIHFFPDWFTSVAYLVYPTNVPIKG